MNLDITAETRAVLESSLDNLIDGFAELVLLYRHENRDASELVPLFEHALTPPASANMAEDVAQAIRLLAYKKLESKLTAIGARIAIPENATKH
jgi:hypothetical protein